MADDNLDLKINVDIVTSNTEKLERERQEFERLNAEILSVARNAKAAASAMSSVGRLRAPRSSTATDDAKAGRDALDMGQRRFSELKRQFAFQRRMHAQEAAERNDAAKAMKEQDAARDAALKAQLSSSKRLSAQRAKAEADAEREIRREINETTRMRDRANRQAIAETRRLERAQERAAQRAAQGSGEVRSGVGRVAATGAAAAAVMGYTGARTIGRGLSSRLDIDTAETNLKIFSDVDDGKGGKRKFTDADIKKLRRGPKGLDNEAIRNGVSIQAALDAYNEVNKAGLLDPMEQTKTLLAATTALELDPKATTKLMGTMARNMGKDATAARLKQTVNALAIGAREDPTQANEIVEGLNRAQPLLAMSKGFSEEDLVALVSGGQSVGIQPGKAGTFLPAIAREILQGNNKFLGKGKRKELNFAAHKLGYRSAKDLAQQFAGPNGKKVYYGILEILSKMPEDQRDQVANALAGGQWGDELLQHVNGREGMKKTDAEIHDPKNANFIDEARNEKMKSWQGMWNQSKAIFSLFWESFGVGFDGILREINDFFLGLHGKFNYDAVSQYVRDALDGLKEGLGLDTWKEALESIFPSDIGGLSKQIGGFAKGFGEGVKEAATAIKSIVSMFSGREADAESIGRLAGKFLLLSTACVALGPVLGILGGLASIVMGLVGMARAAAGVLTGGAAVGMGGGAAGAMSVIARVLSGGFIVSLAGAIGSMRGEISTLVLNAVRPMVSALWEGLKAAFSADGFKAGGKALLNELVPAPLQRWLEGDSSPTAKGSESHWQDPPMRKPVQELKESLDKNRETIEEGAKVQKQSFEALEDANFQGLIHKSSFSTAGSVFNDTMRTNAARAASPFSGSIGGGSGPAINHSVPGGSLGNGLTGMRRRGIIGGGGGGGVGASDNEPVAPHRGTQQFDSLAPRIMADLRRDFGLDKEGAAAILGNLGHESGGFRFHQEVNPRGGGRGGIGWAQWTGPRRRQYEKWCKDKGLDPKSYEANYSFLRHELQTSEKGGIAAVKNAKGLDGKTAAFEAQFERAGVKAYGSRAKFARRAMGLPDAQAGVSGPVGAAIGSAKGSTGPIGDAAAAAKGLQDIGGGIRSSGWKPTAPASAPAPVGSAPATNAFGGIDPLGSSTPTKPGLGSSTPLRSGSTGGAGRGGQAGGQGNVHAPITINSHGGDAEEVANKVQRHLQAQMGRRVHDFDQGYG